MLFVSKTSTLLCSQACSCKHDLVICHLDPALLLLLLLCHARQAQCRRRSSRLCCRTHVGGATQTHGAVPHWRGICMRASTSPLPPGCRCTSGQRLAGPTHLRQLAVGILQVGHPCRLRADGQHLLLQALVLLLHTAGRPSASWERLVRLGACCGVNGMTWHQRMQHVEPGWPCMTSPAHGAQA